MNKSIYIFYGSLIILFSFSSCEKVIDIDLNSAAPKIVVEGSISDQAAPYSVKISKTVNFNEPNVFPPVSGALVSIYDDLGNHETLTETSAGTYIASTLQGVPGRTYTLNITDNGKNYSARSTMPQPVKIDTVYSKNLSFPEGFGITVFVGFKDPPGYENYYRFIQIVNGIPKNTFYVISDQYQNGTEMYFKMDDDREQKELVKGDSVTVILQSIDKSIYDYFYPMYFGRDVVNPPSNLGTEALGYFSSCAVSSKSFVIP